MIYPHFVYDTVHRVHGVVACEGSMFKSKFANALSTYMVGALGCAAAENKLAVGWGGEAGNMDPSLRSLVRRYCQDALILCRNEASQDVLSELGVASEAGTDYRVDVLRRVRAQTRKRPFAGLDGTDRLRLCAYAPSMRSGGP